MKIFILSIICFNFFNLPSSANQVSALEELEANLKAKTVSIETFLSIREAAVVDRSRLSPYWKKRFDQDPVKPHMGTAILVKNAQIRFKYRLKNPKVKRSSIKAEILDSTLYPIRVIWENPAWADIAQETLLAAEESWDKQISQWGFYPPSIDTESGRYEFYIEDTGMGGGAYTAPYAEVPDTERSDCYTYIVIDPGNEISQVKVAVTHEFQHALQAGMDCNEYIAFWENCATFIQVEMYPDNTSWADAFLSEFQANPNVSISGGDYELLPYYWYGAYFWPLYISYAYAGTDPAPVIIRKIWENSIQNSQFNSINYLEATNTLLNTLSSDIQTAYRDFSVSRLFVGPLSYSSLSTMHLASSWTHLPDIFGEISAAMEHTISPSSDKKPFPFGVNYYKIRSTELSDRRSTLISFTGNENRPWQILHVNADDETVNIHEIVSGAGEITLDTGISDNNYILVINNEFSNLDPEAYYDSHNYELNIAPIGVDFEITDASPLIMEPGNNYQMVVSGNEFLPGATVTFDSTSVEVIYTEYVSETSLLVHMSIVEQAPETNLTLTVLNSDGMQSEFGGLKIQPEIKPEESTGCSCQNANSSSRFSLPIFLLLLLPILLRLKFRPVSN
ncbi:hypothetical protein KKF34_09315 [Myxococcota bacterium]|nr:hypothetical protein [Myxococcota bacterium]MBU1379936.1 hypothetical protein [Myxococcota bacterium]MBU1497062.1 hypothetical protein [Myxococcota bacterium]